MKTHSFFLKTAELMYNIKKLCMFCETRPEVRGFGFCSMACSDSAFKEDFVAYASGDDINDAKCVGTKSSPVGSPRQRSFCARMCGHKKKNTKNKAKKNPDSCINQSLRRWKCRCG